MNKFDDMYIKLDKFDPFADCSRYFVNNEKVSEKTFFDAMCVTDDVEDKIKKAIKGKGKLVGLASVSTDRTTASRKEFVVFTRNDEGYLFFRFAPDTDEVMESFGPFKTFESAKSRADCLGLFESRNVFKNSALFEEVLKESDK